MTSAKGEGSLERPIDALKFENVYQIGGIRTGTLDGLATSGASGVRVALFDTGAGLRFTVALDRGGDIVDAHYNQFGLAYLAPKGIVPPSHAYHSELEWLRSWPGGLVTTCGPESIGGPREQEGQRTSLHGRYSNTPAVVESVINPNPGTGRLDMVLCLLVRDSRMFGPVFEVCREIRCTLGKPEIRIVDEVTNRGDTPVAHHWLYHCNLGYPLLDGGARFVYRGRAQYWTQPVPPGQSILQPMTAQEMDQLKEVEGPLPEHAGTAERGLLVEVEPDTDGLCRVGLINSQRKLALSMSYPAEALPRLANWQHYGPRGCYTSGLEPFYGSLLGPSLDKHPDAHSRLEPGETRRYELCFEVCTGASEIGDLAGYDGPVVPHNDTERNVPEGAR